MITFIFFAVGFVVSLCVTLWVLRGPPPKPIGHLTLVGLQKTPTNFRLWLLWAEPDGRVNHGLFLTHADAKGDIPQWSTILTCRLYQWPNTIRAEIRNE